MLKVAARIQEIAATLERECDQAKCERKYGKGLIRVDWQYARNGFINPTLKHVCTWANGDEGFVPNDEMRDGERKNTMRTTDQL